ncbi:unnamed protein product [Amaranthus hypochondriacus]
MIAYGHKSEEGRYDPLLLLVYYSGKKFIKTVSCLKYVYKAFEMTAVFVSLQVYYSTQLNVAPYLSSVSSSIIHKIRNYVCFTGRSKVKHNDVTEELDVDLSRLVGLSVEVVTMFNNQLFKCYGHPPDVFKISAIVFLEL